MKQFFETYFPASDCFKLWVEVAWKLKNPNQIVSPFAAQLTKNHILSSALIPTQKKGQNQIVSSAMTQLQSTDIQYIKFVSSLMTQISWTHHLRLLSKAKTPEEKIFYSFLTIKDNLTVRELAKTT